MTSRPFVSVNFALTWDARISTRNSTPVDFSSPADKRRLFELRAGADAVLIGRHTLDVENHRMGLPADLAEMRTRKGQPPWPLRVVISNSGQIDPALRIFSAKESPILIHSTRRMSRQTRDQLAPLCDLTLHDADTVDLAGMLRELHDRHNIRRLICEGGGTLVRSLVSANCVDEINLTLCPQIFGGDAAPTLTGLPGEFLPETTACRLAHMEVVGEECFLRYQLGG